MQKVIALCLLSLMAGSRALDQNTANVAEHSQSANDAAGNSWSGTNSETEVNGDFGVAGNNGNVKAHSDDSSFTNLHAADPEGAEQNAQIEGKTAHLTASSGDHAVAETDDGGKESKVVVNDGNTYNVHRATEDTALIEDPQTGAHYDIKGIQAKKINIKGTDIKEMDANFAQAGNGATGTQLKVHEFGPVGPKYYQNLSPPDSKTEGSSKMGVSPFDTAGAINPLDSISPSVVVTADKIKTAPCPEKQFGDAFGNNGFRIHDDVSVELPPTNDDGQTKTWVFPGCFIVHATITIPPNIDISNVGAQADVSVAQAGQLQCDQAMECKSNAAGRPQGSCFYCDFCEADKAHSKAGAVFGDSTNVDWNICEGKPGGDLPLTWKVCPQDASNNYQVLSPSIFSAFKSDISATIKVFLKTGSASGATASKPAICKAFAFLPVCNSGAGSGQTWQLQGCKSSVISYKVSAGASSFGSSNTGGFGGFGGKK